MMASIFADAIASIESAGSKDPYGLLGPLTKGDRAYGRYQIMGANIGPWSKEILGIELTPSQFLANPQYQDAIFEGKFGQYVNKFGKEGAAQAWFAGPGGVGKLDRKDILGTSVGRYGQRFIKALGAPQPPDTMQSQVPQSPQDIIQARAQQSAQTMPQNMPSAPANFLKNPLAFLNTQQAQQAPSPERPPIPTNQLFPIQLVGALRRNADLSRLAQYLQGPSAIAPYRFYRG